MLYVVLKSCGATATRPIGGFSAFLHGCYSDEVQD